MMGSVRLGDVIFAHMTQKEYAYTLENKGLSIPLGSVVKNPLLMPETWVLPLTLEDPTYHGATMPGTTATEPVL